MIDRLARAAASPVSLSSLAVFRIAFGLMMLVSSVRFVVNGWVERVWVEPTFFFKYPGLEWIQVWSPPGLYLHYGVLATLALCIAAGFFYRVSVVAFAITFSYVQAMDVTNYLNHYYLVILLAILMSFMPLHGKWSLDSVLFARIRQAFVPAWMLWILRFQISTVYFFAALAKLGPDWLLHAQPLNIWLNARVETPVVGGLFSEVWIAYVMSWAGFLYDLTIPIWLSIRRTRPLAYLAVIVFHAATWMLFDIGMFPVIMVVATSVFFEPNWPERWLALRRGRVRTPVGHHGPASPHLLLMLALYALVQVAIPLRHYFYAGNVLWNERGMRYAWKVMVREKNGSITYRVRQRASGRTWEVSPLEYLDLRQTMEMSGQPDMIVQLGKHIAGDFESRGLGPVDIYVDAWVSLNGRKSKRLIDPYFNLLNVGYGSDEWILPSPTEPPPLLRGTT